MNIWFTADPHFNHKRANMLMHRPFYSVEEMDEVIIQRYNERVKTNSDTVYIVGDFAYSDHTPYLKRLNGQKNLVLGNHDPSKLVKAAVGWNSVKDMFHLKMPDKTLVVLCHYAMRVWRNSHHGSLHLYGHSHGNLPGDSQSCDVGVDCWDFYPVSLEEIRAKLATSTPRVHVDHHQPKPLVDVDFAEIETRVVASMFEEYDSECIPGN